MQYGLKRSPAQLTSKISTNCQEHFIDLCNDALKTDMGKVPNGIPQSLESHNQTNAFTCHSVFENKGTIHTKFWPF